MLVSEESVTPKLENVKVKRLIFLSCCEAKGMKFRLQVFRTYVHKCSVLDIHLFVQIRRNALAKFYLLHDFWFKFYDKFSPYPIIGFLCIFNHHPV